ncbi:MAG: phosphoglucomutase/phosphomannomutase family protein [Elusimicrobia bacterium]|nr:phosphoglucomutase/phosphomannomutase family protein [Candidatus Obscuribacterium magneticum]
MINNGNNTIKFGTDGWRAVIAEGFTMHNVRRVAQAACDVIRKTSKSRLILIGYDRRFSSQLFAEMAARVASGNGFKVEFSAAPIGSPTLALNVKERKAAMGFMITASHNPPHFNGFKLKGPHGGSADETLTTSIEDRLDMGDIRFGEVPTTKKDFSIAHVAFLKKQAHNIRLSHLSGPVIFDAMHGPGGDLFAKVVPKNGSVIILHNEIDPLFGGVNPEPIEVNLSDLKKNVIQKKAAVGIAVDGDADRIGLIDEKGRFLPPHTVMPLLLLHLIENKKLRGKVIQTVSMGYLPERIARHHNLPFEEVAVGFKHISQKMMREKVLLGGEESGGFGVGLWFPERDGVLCALLILELMSLTKKSLSELVTDLEKRFGASTFKRVDFALSHPVDKNAWTENIKTHLMNGWTGLPIKEVRLIDGVKIIQQDEAWVLMRPSGTEPLVRTYAEGPKIDIVNHLLKEADRLVHLPPPRPPAEAKSLKRRGRKVKIRASR